MRKWKFSACFDSWVMWTESDAICGMTSRQNLRKHIGLIGALSRASRRVMGMLDLVISRGRKVDGCGIKDSLSGSAQSCAWCLVNTSR